MEPTEGELTVAVDAAAQVVYTQGREDFTPKFDQLPPLEANQYREAVVPIVWAALNALPDRATAARLEALRDAMTQVDVKVRAAIDEVEGGGLGTVLTATVNAYSAACREIAESAAP